MSYLIETVERPELTFDEVLSVAERAFGERGWQTVMLWHQYNEAYFEGRLFPVPIIYVPASPYGHWIGLCSGDGHRTGYIYLTRRPWEETRGTVLHEMLHQYLSESGQGVPRHNGQPWRDEIMRISRDHFGREIRANGPKVTKERLPDTASRRSVKVYESGSLIQGEIARWPHSVGIIPPDLALPRPAQSP